MKEQKFDPNNVKAGDKLQVKSRHGEWIDVMYVGPGPGPHDHAVYDEHNELYWAVATDLRPRPLTREEELVLALRNLLVWTTGLLDSGDFGNFKPETIEAIVDARDVLGLPS